MRGIGKFTTHPFFSGCGSRSSVATGIPLSTTQVRELNGSEVNPSVARREERENKTCEVKMKSPFSFLVLLNISNGVHKLVTSLKTFSQLFVLRSKEEEVKEVEMEIGYPTDVKHVTHIGVDGYGSTTTITTNPTINLTNWDININNNNNLNDFLSFPNICLTQFEVSMAAQTQPPSSSSSLIFS